MQLKKHRVNVNKTDPFENDWLNRKSFANQLTNIIKNNKQGKIVLGLSGQWGEGKTTFVKMWKAQMENEDIPCIYFDAFEYDYMDNVFLSIAVEVYNFAQEKGVKASSDYLENSKNLFNHLQKIKMKTSPIQLDTDVKIEQEKAVKVADAIEDNLNSLLNNAFEQALKQRRVISDFKTSLSELASNASQQDLPLVIIVDELDRCKPSFAVEILEKVKHLFLVENVIFVLSMHHEQLEESIKKIYGQNIDAHTYLQKFIDYPARLPAFDVLNDEERNRYFWNQIEYLGLPLVQRENTDLGGAYILFSTLSEYYSLSYREINRALQYLKYFLNVCKSVEDDAYIKMYLMVFISILKVKKESLIDKIRHGNISLEDFQKETSDFYQINEYSLEVLQKLIYCCFASPNTMYEAEYASYERRFLSKFSNFISDNENRVLIALVRYIESFEVY